MKKVKNPRSGLSWSEITLVLIKKTLRLVLKFESGWRCCFGRWAAWCSCRSSVVPAPPHQISPASEKNPPQPPVPFPYLPLWHSVGSKRPHHGCFSAGSVLGCMGGAWRRLCCMPWGGRGAAGSELMGRALSVAFPGVCVTLAVVPLPTALSFRCAHIALDCQYGPLIIWCSCKQQTLLWWGQVDFANSPKISLHNKESSLCCSPPPLPLF